MSRKKSKRYQQRGRLKITAPATQAVSLADAKEYLRVDQSAEDNRITAIIQSAESLVKNQISQSLKNETIEYYLDAWPYDHNNVWWDGMREGALNTLVSGSDYIDIPWGPNVAVTAFETIDNSDVAYLFDSSQYHVDNTSKQGRVVLSLGSVWPATILKTTGGIKITFTAGYGAADSDVPAAIRQAILESVAAQYEKRGDAVTMLPPAALNLLLPYKDVKI